MLDAFAGRRAWPHSQERRARKRWEALLHEQTLQKRRENELANGELLNAADVERAGPTILRIVRTGMLTVVPRAAQRLSHLSRQDVSELDREVREVLREIGNDEGSQVRDALANMSL